MNLVEIIIVFIGLFIFMELLARVHYYYRKKSLTTFERIKFIFLGKWLINDANTSALYINEIATSLGVDQDFMLEVLCQSSGKDKDFLKNIFLNSSGKIEVVEFQSLLGFLPTPNQHFGHLIINDLGFRGKRWSLNKPTGVKRVLLLGGSVAYGRTATSNENTIAEELERKLNENFQSSSIKRWQVFNLSIPDFISFQELITLIKIGLRFDPDIVISFSGLNDAYHYLDTKKMNEPSSFRSVKIAYDAFFGSPGKRFLLMLSSYLISVYYTTHILQKTVNGGDTEELSPYIYTIW